MFFHFQLYITYYNVAYSDSFDLNDSGNAGIAFSEGFLGICCLAQLIFIMCEPCASRELRGVLHVEYRAAHPKKVKIAADHPSTGVQIQERGKDSRHSPKMDVMPEPSPNFTVQMNRRYLK